MNELAQQRPLLQPELHIGWSEGVVGSSGTIAEGRSSDCGPTAPSSVVIEGVEGDAANDEEGAVKNAHSKAKKLGQISCDGGACGDQQLCKYKEDQWRVTSIRKEDNRFIAKGVTSGHCQCET